MLNSSLLRAARGHEACVSGSRLPQELIEQWLEGLLAEFVHNASLSCLTAIIAMTRDRDADRRARALDDLLPTEPSCFPAVVGALMEQSELMPLVIGLRGYYGVQSTARGLTVLHRFANEGDAAATDLTTLRVVWQDVATAADRALREFDKISPDLCKTLVPVRFRHALELIASGQSASMADCWPRDLPVTGERRLVTRTGVNAHVRIERGMSLLRLLATNVSHRGLGVKGLHGVVAGERMRILWKPGVAIAARVTWTSGDVFGLEIVDQSAEWHGFVRHLLEATQYGS